MKKTKAKDGKWKIFLFLAAVLLIIDQVTKLIIEMYVSQSITIIPKVLSITNVHNYGAGFGMFQGQRLILIFISIIVIGLILYLYDKIPDKRYVVVSTALILSGAFGNLIDRIFLGYVMDFIDIGLWPAFNIADSAITIGAIGIIYYLIRND